MGYKLIVNPLFRKGKDKERFIICYRVFEISLDFYREEDGLSEL